VNGSATATYDARDELVSDGSATYTYTARGTLAAKTPTSGTAESLTYDAFDRLATDGSTGYAYDSLDRVVTAGSKTLSYSGSGTELASDGTQTYSLDPAGAVTAMKQGTTSQLALQNTHGDVTATFTATGTTLNGSAAYAPSARSPRRPGRRPTSGIRARGPIRPAARWTWPPAGTTRPPAASPAGTR